MNATEAERILRGGYMKPPTAAERREGLGHSGAAQRAAMKMVGVTGILGDSHGTWERLAPLLKPKVREALVVLMRQAQADLEQAIKTLEAQP